MTPTEYCRQQAAQSGSSFYYSFLFLPPAKRDAMMALYAFCRAVDDIVDTVQDPHVAASKLGWWRAEINRLYAQDNAHPISHPIAIALQTPCQQYQLPQSQFLEIIAGMEMDLHQFRYIDDEALNMYCYRVASVVGLLSARIFANGSDACHSYALHLGMALQKINILRDIGEDAMRGRVYLPHSLLQAHGLNAQDILNRSSTPQLKHALATFAKQAQAELKLAIENLPAQHIREQRAGLIMGRVYTYLMFEIINTDYAVLHQRISLTPLRKLLLAWRSWVFPTAAVQDLRRLANRHIS